MLSRFHYFFCFIFVRDYSSNSFLLFKDSAIVFKKIIVQLSFSSYHFKSSRSLALFLVFIEFLTHQKPIFSFSKKDVAAWRLRKHDLVSIFVTLRKLRMFFFIERFLLTYLCRLRTLEASSVSLKQTYLDTRLVFKVSDILMFTEFEKELFRFQNKSELFPKGFFLLCSVVVDGHSRFSLQHKRFLFSSFQIPFTV